MTTIQHHHFGPIETPFVQSALCHRADFGSFFCPVERLWTILFIGLTLALIVIGQMGGGLIHQLLAGATLILVVQLFSLLFPGDETMI